MYKYMFFTKLIAKILICILYIYMDEVTKIILERLHLRVWKYTMF